MACQILLSFLICSIHGERSRSYMYTQSDTFQYEPFQRARAILAEANVLAVVQVEEMDQRDVDPTDNSTYLIVPTRAAEAQFNGVMKVRFDGTYTLIANVTHFEEESPAGAAWPEARAQFTVQPAYSRLTLLGFTDPPNPRVGDDVTVMYVVRNNGPDAVTGLQLFTRADYRLDFYRLTDPNPPVPPVPGPFVFGE